MKRTFTFEEAAKLLNFGAFLAFIGVNLACQREYFWRRPKTLGSFLLSFLVPAIGAVVCLVIWTSLPVKTLLIGGGWMLAGIGYLAVRTSGFRKPVPLLDFSDKD